MQDLALDTEQILHYLTSARHEFGSKRITPDNPISLTKLAIRFSMTTKEMKDALAEIKKAGHPITTDGKGGYFMAEKYTDSNDSQPGLFTCNN